MHEINKQQLGDADLGLFNLYLQGDFLVEDDGKLETQAIYPGESRRRSSSNG